MPTIDYTCQHCGHRFTRVALRGEEAPPLPCPQCRTPAAARPAKDAASLFDGIAPFSSLAKDTN